ncbi:ABC transporter permease [Chloroflexota bacterium]|nr:ABC transporter permease [Chloroflexota bacterium]
MKKYIFRRVIQILFTLIIFQTLLFVILDAQPGDITNLYLTNPKVTPEIRDQMRVILGLDKPPVIRYFQWLGNFVRGNLGVSFSNYPRPVMDIILERAPRTLALFLTNQIISFLLGYFLGKQMAWHRDTFFEYGMTIVGVILFTIFTPWFGLMMIYLFGIKLQLLPIGKFLDPSLWRNVEVPANTIFYYMILTAVIAGLVYVAIILLTRKTSRTLRQVIQFGGFLGLIGLVVLAWSLTPYGYLAVDILKHMILPVTVSTLVSFAGTMLLMRNTMLETLREDFVMAARAKGLSEHVVRDKHAARNAFLPVFTNLIIGIPFALSGGIITETIFSWPGMGLTLLQAVNLEDIPLAMGTLSFVGVLALSAHLIADVAYAFLDPRIRYQ